MGKDCIYLKTKNIFDIIFKANTRSGQTIYWDILGNLIDKDGNKCSYIFTKYTNPNYTPYYKEREYTLTLIAKEDILYNTITILTKGDIQ